MAFDPDRSLVEACQDLGSDGFEPAFEALYLRYRGPVYNVAYRITGNVQDAMDVTQETFGILLRKIGGFSFASRFSRWLFRIVVNLSIDTRRRNHARKDSVPLDGASWQAGSRRFRDGGDHEDPGGETLADPRVVSPLDHLASAELHGAVKAAIDSLSPKLGAILVLRYLQEMSYEDLAETLEISMGTVKSRLARAHLALERALGPLMARHGYPVVSQERSQEPPRDPAGARRGGGKAEEGAA